MVLPLDTRIGVSGALLLELEEETELLELERLDEELLLGVLERLDEELLLNELERLDEELLLTTTTGASLL